MLPRVSEVLSRLIELSAQRFKLSSASMRGLSASSDIFESLGVDSMQVLSMLSEIELEFDVEIPDYELRGVKTFGELSKVIERRL